MSRLKQMKKWKSQDEVESVQMVGWRTPPSDANRRPRSKSVFSQPVLVGDSASKKKTPPSVYCAHLAVPSITVDSPDEPLEVQPEVSSVAGRSKTFQVTNYGPVDMDSCEICKNNSVADLPAELNPSGKSLLAPPEPTKKQVSYGANLDRVITDNASSPTLSTCSDAVSEDSIQTDDRTDDEEDEASPFSSGSRLHDENANNQITSFQPTKVMDRDLEKGHPHSNKTHKRMSIQPTAFNLPLIHAARRGRLFTKRRKQRLMEKSGICNMHFVHVEKRGLRYISDLFTTFLEIRWRYTVLVFFMSFCFTWIVFGLLWWGLYTARRDSGLECIVGVDSFITALLFSIETQHTIGYGTRSITDQCPSGTVLLMVQSTIGVLTQCIVTGIVFAKLALPKRRGHTVMFSKNAVICMQDGELCLEFRVGNMRSTQMMGTTINAMLVQAKTSPDGQVVSTFQRTMEFTTLGEDHFYFLAWPIRVKHKIDEKSPLWTLSAEELLVSDFEIIVVLEAVCEATGGSIQTRTSYLPSEIQWGYTLAPLFTKHKCEKGMHAYNINFRHFDKLAPVETPECSAAYLAQRRKSKPSKMHLEIVDEVDN